MAEAPTIVLELANLGALRVGLHGLADEELSNLPHRIRGFRARIAAEQARGLHAYLNLPGDEAALEQILRLAQPRLGRFEHLVVLGIGGSSLGLRALVQALAPKGGPRLHVVDNTDPALVAGVLAEVDLARTLVVAVSKSGGTLETVLSLGLFVQKLRQRGLPLREHLLVVTDPEAGPLRAFARQHGLDAADIPPGVGGRFSVLTAAGLLPAALLGLDVAALLRGAARTVELCTQGPLERNWPAWLGLMATDLCRNLGKRILVFMPYSSRLRAVSEWFVQLWDESLGKARASDGSALEAGQTAVPACGATDQHAQLQLFLEGPNDKVLLFARIEQHEPDLPLGSFEWADFSAAFVQGGTLGKVLNAQQAGTAAACTERKRPNATLVLPRLDAPALGELLMGLQAATTFAGMAWGVNTYDQPAVELGKGISRRMLGG
ncbi:MAG: glucose-6-phosphate isomerase [Planctomycetes bacterium]|nr:glucose-6-phosphate isomerase [Planctomycetota bacterium]